jgi:DinB superfamily
MMELDVSLDVSTITAVLSRTPGALRALLEGLPEAWLGATEGEGSFSPPDVVGHLIHGEKTDWVPRIKLILVSGTTQPFVPFDRLGFREAIRGRSMTALLGEFESARRSSLDALQELALTPAQLALEGRHPELGRVTLGQLLAAWAVHDLNHVGQVVRVMSKRYSAVVGPWKAYLGILNQ